MEIYSTKVYNHHHVAITASTVHNKLKTYHPNDLKLGMFLNWVVVYVFVKPLHYYFLKGKCIKILSTIKWPTTTLIKTSRS